jgi:hypothetical protein
MRKSRDFSRLGSDICVIIFHIGSAHDSIPVLTEPFVGSLQPFGQRLYAGHECTLLGHIQIIVMIVKAEKATLGMPFNTYGFQFHTHGIIAELAPVGCLWDTQRAK